MRTTKPISTISYNSPPYLRDRLNELIKAKKISFWAFIPHQAEDDEAGKKPHIHLFIEPAKLLQTEDLKDFFQEPDLNNIKPLGVMSFRLSKFDDWYMYSKHDASYLASKGQSRRFHYEHDTFTTSDGDELLCRVRSINLLAQSPYKDMQDAIQHGVSWIEYASRGLIPIQQLSNWQRAWDIMQSVCTNRNGRKTHTPADNVDVEADIEALQVDVNTGELLSDIDSPRQGERIIS